MLVLACKFTGFWMLLTVFEVFIGVHCLALIQVRFLFTFVGVLLARVDAYARLSSVWGCFVECGALNLSIGVRVVIWLRIFCFPWTSSCRLLI